MKKKLFTVLPPIVAILTLMIGLRIGAGEAVRAAVVFGAPLGHAGPDGKARLAWQMLTFIDDRGVKETIPMRDLTVLARAKGREARWQGESNADGIAEIALELEGVAFGDDVDLEVREGADPRPLATGRVAWREAARTGAGSGLGRSAGSMGGERRVEPGGAARPTLRAGAIGLDVVVEGDRLIAGFPTSLWIHATPPPGVAAAGLTLVVDPEPGLLADRATTTTCGAGWAEVAVTAQAHVVGIGVAARAQADGPEAPAGKWFGALPVAPGAFFVSMPRVLKAGEASSVVLIAPNPREVVYAELDDTRGRVAAAALKVAVEPGDATPRARFELPPLAPGLHWLVVSGEPRGAEQLAGAAVAKSIFVGAAVSEDPSVDVQDACSIGPWLAQRPAPGFPRWVALDGLPGRSAQNLARHTLGLVIGLVSLLAAGLLETLLLVATSREARIALQLAALELDAGDATAEKVTARPPGGGVVVAVLIAVMGLALLGVLLVAKG